MKCKKDFRVLFIILFLFAIPQFCLNGASSATDQILLTPQKFTPGKIVTVTLRLIKKPRTSPLISITGGVDNKVLYKKSYYRSIWTKIRIPSFKWKALAGRHRIWFKIKRNNSAKILHFVKNVFVTYPIKPIRLKKKRPVFRLKHKYRLQLRQVARLMLSRASDSIIKQKIKGIYQAYHSETQGAGHQADEEALKALQDEVQKEIWEQQQQKDEEQLKEQQEHIRRLMEMIKEMMKIMSNTMSKINVE